MGTHLDIFDDLLGQSTDPVDEKDFASFVGVRGTRIAIGHGVSVVADGIQAGTTSSALGATATEIGFYL